MINSLSSSRPSSPLKGMLRRPGLRFLPRQRRRYHLGLNLLDILKMVFIFVVHDITYFHNAFGLLRPTLGKCWIRALTTRTRHAINMHVLHWLMGAYDCNQWWTCMLIASQALTTCSVDPYDRIEAKDTETSNNTVTYLQIGICLTYKFQYANMLCIH